MTTRNLAEKKPPSGTLRGLDWLNFFLADVQTGVGPFLAIYLAGYHWNEQQVGLALTVGGIAGILANTPAGALVDRLRSKRALIAGGVVFLAVGAGLIAFFPLLWPVMIAQILIGGTSTIFGPAICAVSLGIVGHKLFDRRQGRNQTFNSAGNVVAAVSMGLIGYFISNRGIFFFAILLAIPTIFTLFFIRPNEIDYELARGSQNESVDAKPARVWALFEDRPLVVFLVCAVMFHFANAAMGSHSVWPKRRRYRGYDHCWRTTIGNQLYSLKNRFNTYLTGIVFTITASYLAPSLLSNRFIILRMPQNTSTV